MVLQGTFQRSGTKLYVVSFSCHEILCFGGYLDVVSEFFYSVQQRLYLYVDNASDGIDVKLVEGDDFIESVEEFRRELFA